jgi:hypothetical protein
MSATIIGLPTSAPAPVQNPRHRGRYPSSVVPSWRVTRQRRERAGRATYVAEPEAEPSGPVRSAEYLRGVEIGRERARIERLAMETLKNLSTVLSYLAMPEDDR